jgi:hypothetical protein
MNLKRVVAAVLLMTFGVFASDQSLADAARKEKERREALKTKPTVTVTNADLSKIKKIAATNDVKAEVPVPNPDEAENPEAIAKPSAVAAVEPAASDAGLAAEARRRAETDRAELQGRWEREKERVEFLTLKMRALGQQLNTFNSMTPKNKIQKDLAETSLQLQASAAEEARLKKDLDKIPPPSGKTPIK